MPWLVVGLGNPGPRYAGHRHNIGFMVVDELGRRTGAAFREKFKGLFDRVRMGAEDVVLLEPLTWMNLSGPSVGAAATFFKAEPAGTIVVHDELDLPFGSVQVKVGGGHAGHNGLRSIFDHFPKDFVRVRCGIGRPPHGDVTNWVLSDFDGVDRAVLPDLVARAADAVETIVTRGTDHAMRTVNVRRPDA